MKRALTLDSQLPDLARALIAGRTRLIRELTQAVFALGSLVVALLVFLLF